MPERTAILLLAAGTASRMGQPKQLLPWRGTSLLRHAVLEAQRVPDSEVYLVAGAYFERIVQEVNGLDVSVVRNVDYAEGLGGSIAVGVREVQRTRNPYRHIAVTLADQPAVTTEYLMQLIDCTSASGSIVATRYGDRAGVPAVFPSTYIPQLALLSGDRGASGLLNAPESTVQLIDPPFHLFDIDTPEDYRRHAGN